MRDEGIDVWLTFVRETECGTDPILPFLIEGSLTWISALLVPLQGPTTAIVGRYDGAVIEANPAWENIVLYDDDISGALCNQIETLCPTGGKIGVNFSRSDDKADGISHGMFLLLNEYLRQANLDVEVVSAERVAQRVRGSKSSLELDLIRAAIKSTEGVFAKVREWAVLGMSEIELQRLIHEHVDSHGWDYSWDKIQNPIVNFGPESIGGHGAPSSEITLAKGHLLHIDLGLQIDGYSSDIQRCWYVGDSLPDDLLAILSAVNEAISAAAHVVRPGVPGYKVDEAARARLTDAGFPEYMHATGHQVGRRAHDGGCVLGPRWPRYGLTPDLLLHESEVYTLELGVQSEKYGYLGIEEMVVVTSDGCQFLTTRMLDLPLLEL